MVKVGSSTDADQCTASKDLDSEISAANNQESTHEMIQLLAKQIEDLKSAINLYSSRVSQNQEKLEEIQLKINQDKSKEIELKKKLDNLMKAQSLLIESCRGENTNQESVEIQTNQNVTVNEKINLPTTSRDCNDRRNSVEYPIDLSTIKTLFENHFYRLITSAQFDIRYSATNAEKFNERHSQIVKQARLITDICLHLIKKTTEHDITALYHELADAYHFSDTEVNVEDDIDKPSTSTNRPRRPTTSRSSNITQTISSDWRVACRQLLETLWQCGDSIPFREPVDRLEHPDYYQVIDTPMDLGTVKENLLGGKYESPTEFAKDVKLIFTNSKTYNTNTRSKIYSMTIRLAAMFEEHMRKIINKWNSVTRQKDPNKTVSRSKVKGKSKSKTKKGSPTNNNLTNGAAPSKRKANRSISDDDDDDKDDNDDVPVEHGDEDEDDDHSVDFTPTKRPLRQVNHNGAGPSTLTNGYSKHSSKKSRFSFRCPYAKRKMASDHSDEDEDNSDEVSSSSCESSDDSPPKRRTRSRKSGATAVNGHDRDSDEMYEPSAKGKQSRNHRAKNSKRTRPNRTPEKRYVVDNDEEEEQDEQLENKEGDEDHFAAEQSDDSEEIGRRNKSSRKARASAVRNKIQDSTSKVEESNVQEGAGLATATITDNEIISLSTDNEIEDGQEQGEVRNKEKEDEEDAEDVGAEVQKNGVSDSESSSGTTKYRLRSSDRKRVHYNDDSDDDDDEDYNEDSYDSVTPATTRLRWSVKRPYYGKVSDEDQSSSQTGLGGRQDMTPSISVSSRGRVRKMTPKVMSALR